MTAGAQGDGARRAPLWPYLRVSEDIHVEALERLAAVCQYLYDTMNGDAESDRDAPDPLPALAMEKVRDAQNALHEAVRLGVRARRLTVGSALTLVEHLGRGR